LLLLVAMLSQATSDAKLIPRRDPLDGALDATEILIVKQLSPGLFLIEEVFLGASIKGQSLSLPGFSMVVEDRSTPIAGRERIEPIGENTRILVFLSRAHSDLTFRHARQWEHSCEIIAQT
jgi:hypothetical protein